MPNFRLFATAFAVVVPLFLYGQALAAVVISEVMWSGSDLSTSDEWLEVANTGTGSVSLTGWRVTSVNSSGQEVTIATFGPDVSIDVDEHVVVSKFPAEQSRLMEASFLVSGTVSLPNTKLLLRLYDGSGSLLDTIDDGVGVPFAGSNAALPGWKASMERVDLLGPGNSASNWKTAATFLGFDDGAPLYGTPGFLNGSGPLVDAFAPAEAEDVVAEVVDAGTGRTLSISWKPSTSLDLMSQAFIFDPALLNGSGTVLLPATATGFVIMIDPDLAYAVLLASKDLSGNESEGVEISVEPYVEPEISSSSYSSSPLPPSPSPEERGSSSSSGSLPPEEEGSGMEGSPENILITEVLPDPAGDELDQWIEIANVGQEIVDVTGWVLENVSTGKVFTFGSGSLAAGEYRAVSRRQSGIILSHGGGEVRIKRGTEIIDSLSYPSVPEGVSFGRQGETLEPFCSPTEGMASGQDTWSPELHIQSGSPRAEGRVSINLEVTDPTSILESGRCTIDFGDGSNVQSCNPPSHSYGTVGTYTVTATLLNYCGTTVIRTLSIEVLPVPQSTPATPASTSSPSTPASTGTTSQSPTIPVTPAGDFVLVGALPDPEGSDTGNEWIEIQNRAGVAADIAGWKLRTSSTYTFTSILFQPDEVRRLGSPDAKFTLKNSDGSVALLDSSSAIRSEIKWAKAATGKVYKPGASPSGRYPVNLQAVIDGDTLDVVFQVDVPFHSGRQARVRLLGIDTPEITHVNPAIKRFGLESKEYLESLMEDKKIELEFDTEYEDAYGRVLAYLYLDGALVQAEILKNGYGTVLKSFPFSKRAEFEGWEALAKKGKLGHWGDGEVRLIGGESEEGEVESSEAEPMGRPEGVIISEIFPSPASGEDEWVELVNITDQEISLNGAFIDDEEKGSKPHAFSEETVIGAHSFFVLRSDDMKIAFNNDGDSVRLLASDGSVIEDIPYPTIKSGQAFARALDGTWCVTAAATPGAENQCVAPSGNQSAKSTKVKATAKKKAPAKKAVVKYKVAGQSNSGTVGAGTGGFLSGLTAFAAESSEPSGGGGLGLADIILALLMLGFGGVGVGWSILRKKVTSKKRGNSR